MSISLLYLCGLPVEVGPWISLHLITGFEVAFAYFTFAFTLSLPIGTLIIGIRSILGLIYPFCCLIALFYIDLYLLNLPYKRLFHNLLTYLVS